MSAKTYVLGKKALEWGAQHPSYRTLFRDIDDFIASYKEANKKAGYYDSIPTEKVEEMLAAAKKRTDKLAAVLAAKKGK